MLRSIMPLVPTVRERRRNERFLDDLQRIALEPEEPVRFAPPFADLLAHHTFAAPATPTGPSTATGPSTVARTRCEYLNRH